MPLVEVMLKNEDIKLEVDDFIMSESEVDELKLSEIKVYEKKLDDTFICDRCGGTFTRKPALRYHMRHCLFMENYYGTDKPFSELPVCGKIWEEKNHVASHQNITF